MLVEKVQQVFCFVCIIAVVWREPPVMLHSICDAQHPEQLMKHLLA